MSKATFSKMEVTDTTTGEAECEVLIEGEVVATIRKEVEDIGGTGFEYVASHYEVELWNRDEIESKSFVVRRYRRGFGGNGTTGEFETARKALAAAKAWARSEV